MDLPEEDAGSYVVKENNRTELKLVLSRCNIEGAKQSSSISKPVVKLHMPVSRVKGIMKTGLHPTTSISCVSQEAAVLVSKATVGALCSQWDIVKCVCVCNVQEMFISNLVSQSFEEAGSKGQSELVYDNLGETLQWPLLVTYTCLPPDSCSSEETPSELQVFVW